MSEQPGRYQRSPNALIGSMLVVLVAIIGFVVFRTLTRGNQDVTQPTVDYASAATQARSEGLVTAPAPEPMPKGWRATSVRYAGKPDPTWHIGILTTAKTYVAIEEARTSPGELVATYVGKDARRGGTVTIKGTSWDAWRGSDGYGLTRRTAKDSVLVGGPAGMQAAVELAGRLGSAQGQS